MSADSSQKQDAPLSKRIHNFFYAEEVPYSLALVRIAMPLILLSLMLPRWFNSRELYSADGAPTPLGFVYGWPNLFPVFSGEITVVLHSVLLLALIASIIGWCTRFSLGISFVLYVFLNMQDSVSTITKYSVIASHVMLLLTLSQCGAVWSLDAYLKGRRKKSPWPGDSNVENQKFPVWPQRLMQLMIGIVYFGAAITKMHTPAFFSGDQMTFWMLSHVNFSNPGGELLSQFPAVVVASAYLTITWEMLFLFLAWKGWGRRLMISFGLVFHVMTAVTLGLYVFPVVCASVYLAFLREEDFQAFAVRFRRLQRRWKFLQREKKPIPVVAAADPVVDQTPSGIPLSWFVYASAMILVSVVGLGAEHLRDPYGLRRPEGPYTLKEIPAEVARKMLDRTEPIRDEDKIFSFDIGTFTVGDSLSNRRRVFKHGETLLAQIHLNPPHETMPLECNLHDGEGRLIMRQQMIILRENFRGHRSYALTKSFPPGEYQLILSTGGKELSRRVFQLESDGSPKAPPLNANAN